MRPIARLAFAAALAAAPLTALPAAAAAQTPAATAGQGLSITAVSEWLTAKGGQVSAVQHQGGETFVTVTDGPLNWTIFFYGCTADMCGEIQFSAVFSNPAITLEKVNDWNRDHRFLKAFYLTGSGGEPAAAVQYDVLVQPGQGVDQLADPGSVWVALVAEFARTVGYLRPAGAPADAPATPPVPAPAH